MRLEERVVGDVTVLAVSGRMTMNEDYGVLRQRVRNLVQKGRRKLVLNLAAVSYMDSTCLGEIVSGLATVKNRGGRLQLANLTQRIERLMAIAGLMSVFQTFGSEQEAVRSLAPADES
jgi:anti-sigma B factor antagonist